MRVVLALAAGFAGAMAAWLAGMFITGEYYWFMQTGPYPENASTTRVEMLFCFFLAASMTYTFKGRPK